MNQPLTHPLEFRGSGSEYAKIYFVNLALSIITLGIYSAWAKVRNKRYFHGNTLIDGNSFDYHAQPLQILKGRLLVVGFFILYNVAIGYMPLLGFAFLVLFLLALPWLVLKSKQFNMRNTSYRQIRFDFSGSLGKLFLYYVIMPIGSVLTLGLMHPYTVFKQREYIANSTIFGRSPFFFKGDVGTFYQTYIIVILASSLFMFAIMALVIAIAAFLGDGGSFLEGFKEAFAHKQVQELVSSAASQPDSKTLSKTYLAAVYAAIGGFYAFMIIISLAATTYINTRITNHIFNNLKLSFVRFKMDIRFWKLLGIHLSNIFLILLTLGVYLPWAKVRVVRYKLSCVIVYAADLEQFVASETEQTKALGEEMSDFLDVDIGF